MQALIHRLLLLVPLALACSGCLARALVVTERPVEGGREVRDVVYYEGPGYDDDKHRLNLFIPPGEGPHPVIVFVHGGCWFFGDRIEFTDPYTNLGRRFAGRGILTAIISYRLSPEHKHPAHIEDVAAAVAWTFANVQDYGGDPDRIFLMGHSAGAQLAALAASDPTWLGRHGIRPAQLAGVVGIAGPYDVHHLGQSLLLGLMVLPAFGEDASVWRQVSPATHLSRARDQEMPPFFVVWGDSDPEIIHRHSRWFVDALRRQQIPVETFEAPFRGHVSIITEAGDRGDPLGEVIERFVESRGRAAMASH